MLLIMIYLKEYISSVAWEKVILNIRFILDDSVAFIVILWANAVVF